jgi:transcriptional regulator with XRE-family HTH domain
MDEAAELKQRFGRLVAAHRKRRGLTQVGLSEVSGLSADMIVRIEGGGTGVRFPNIARLAKALEIDPAELFTPDIPRGALDRTALTNLTARLAGLSDADLVWLGNVIDAALSTRS